MLESELIKSSGVLLYKIDPVINDIKFLLLKASNKPFHWTPPKGRLDEGESTLDAAFRETLEESGLHPSSYTLDPNFVEVLYYKAHDADKECVYHLAELNEPFSQVVLSDEHTEYKWLSLNEIPDYCDKPSLREMFTKAHEYIIKKKN